MKPRTMAYSWIKIKPKHCCAVYGRVLQRFPTIISQNLGISIHQKLNWNHQTENHQGKLSTAQTESGGYSWPLENGLLRPPTLPHLQQSCALGHAPDTKSSYTAKDSYQNNNLEQQPVWTHSVYHAIFCLLKKPPIWWSVSSCKDTTWGLETTYKSRCKLMKTYVSHPVLAYRLFKELPTNNYKELRPSRLQKHIRSLTQEKFSLLNRGVLRGHSWGYVCCILNTAVLVYIRK